MIFDWKNPNFSFINFRIDTLSKLLSVISNSEVLSSRSIKLTINYPSIFTNLHYLVQIIKA